MSVIVCPPFTLQSVRNRFPLNVHKANASHETLFTLEAFQ
ncbi:hypothetical protein URH17368_1922 [Alicyclobacillus hesperidum URH17-3-68]|nr:hypothetical protein URH17368_1922 [Alicyclobacillus hesperidum URH17-3-68]